MVGVSKIWVKSDGRGKVINRSIHVVYHVFGIPPVVISLRIAGFQDYGCTVVLYRPGIVFTLIFYFAPAYIGFVITRIDGNSGIKIVHSSIGILLRYLDIGAHGIYGGRSRIQRERLLH